MEGPSSTDAVEVLTETLDVGDPFTLSNLLSPVSDPPISNGWADFSGGCHMLETQYEMQPKDLGLEKLLASDTLGRALNRIRKKRL